MNKRVTSIYELSGLTSNLLKETQYRLDRVPFSFTGPITSITENNLTNRHLVITNEFGKIGQSYATIDELKHIDTFTGSETIITQITDTSNQIVSDFQTSSNIIINTSNMIYEGIEYENNAMKLFHKTTCNQLLNITMDDYNILNTEGIKLIVNNEYDGNLTVNGTLTINGNMMVEGVANELLLSTDILQMETFEVSTDTNFTNPSIDVYQFGNCNIMNIYSCNQQKIIVTKEGFVGIGKTQPNYILDISSNINISGRYKIDRQNLSIQHLNDYPSEFSPEAHIHDIDDIENLNTTIRNKQDIISYINTDIENTLTINADVNLTTGHNYKINGDDIVFDGNSDKLWITSPNQEPTASFSGDNINSNQINNVLSYFEFKSTTEAYSITFVENTVCDVLVVGGGGAGGNHYGGGGGAGSCIYIENFVFTSGTYDIFVGKGGDAIDSIDMAGNNGDDSYIVKDGIDIIRAIGGGGGDTSGGSGEVYSTVVSGGSTGGASGSGSIVNISELNTPSGIYGNTGGHGLNNINGFYAGGGGGGSGSIGGNATSHDRPWGWCGYAGSGGEGRKINITGKDLYYAAGGGGGIGPYGFGGYGGSHIGGNGSVSNQKALNGKKNTGSGGGGGGYNTTTNSTSGAGGSGIVIIRWNTTKSLISYKNIMISNENNIIVGKNQYLNYFHKYNEVRKYPPCPAADSFLTDESFTKYQFTIRDQPYGNGIYYTSQSSGAYGYDSIQLYDGILYDQRYTYGVHTGKTFLNRGVIVLASAKVFSTINYPCEWIKLQMPTQIYLAYIKIYARNILFMRAPAIYRVYGSNDDVNWTLLIDNNINAKYTNLSDESYSLLFHTSPHTRDLKKKDKYSYFALCIRTIKGDRTKNIGLAYEHCNFKELEFYGSESYFIRGNENHDFYSDTTDMLVWYKFDDFTDSSGNNIDMSTFIGFLGAEGLKLTNEIFEVTTPSNNYFSPPGSFSISFWAKSSMVSGKYHIVSCSSTDGWKIEVDDFYIYLLLYKNDYWYKMGRVPFLNNNNIYHIVVCLDYISETQQNISLYINGILYHQDNNGIDDMYKHSNDNLKFGDINSEIYIRDFRMYNRVLHHEEVQILYHIRKKNEWYTRTICDSTTAQFTYDNFSISGTVDDTGIVDLTSTSLTGLLNTTTWVEASVCFSIRGTGIYSGHRNIFRSSNFKLSIVEGFFLINMFGMNFRIKNTNFLPVDHNDASRYARYWRHYVFIFWKDGTEGNFKLYMNGREIYIQEIDQWISSQYSDYVTQDTTKNGTWTTGNISILMGVDDANLEIGAAETILGPHFRIYNRILTDDEIKTLYDMFENPIDEEDKEDIPPFDIINPINSLIVLDRNIYSINDIETLTGDVDTNNLIVNENLIINTNFKDDLNLFTKFPRYGLTNQITTYPSPHNTVSVGIISSLDVDSYKLFDNSSSKFEIPSSGSYVESYTGEYLKIDMGEYLIPTSLVISPSPTSSELVKAPKTFRLYGSRFPDFEIIHNGLPASASRVPSSKDHFFMFTSTTGVNSITFHRNTICDILMVGGGAGGDYSSPAASSNGGGHGGNILWITSQIMSPGHYCIKVGEGGIGGTATMSDRVEVFQSDGSRYLESINNIQTETIPGNGGNTTITFRGETVIAQGGKILDSDPELSSLGPFSGTILSSRFDGFARPITGTSLWWGGEGSNGAFDGSAGDAGKGGGGGGAIEYDDVHTSKGGIDGLNPGEDGKSMKGGNGGENTGGGGGGGNWFFRQTWNSNKLITTYTIGTGGSGGSGIVIFRFKEPTEIDLDNYDYLINHTGTGDAPLEKVKYPITTTKEYRDFLFVFQNNWENSANIVVSEIELYGYEHYYTKFPRYPMITNELTYTDGSSTRVRVYNSSQHLNYAIWNVFSGITDEIGWVSGPSTYNNDGTAKNENKIGYSGELFIIDLGEAIILKRIKIYPRQTYKNRAPKEFKIFGSDTVTSFGNPNDETWTEIFHVSISYVNDHDIYTIPISIIHYQYYMIVINKIFEEETFVQFSEFEFFGNSVDLSSQWKITHSATNDLEFSTLSGRNWTTRSLISPTATGGYTNFTGVHHCKALCDELYNDEYIGQIVTSTKKYSKINSIYDTENIQRNIDKLEWDCLPVVEISSKVNDNNVFGVITKIEDSYSKQREIQKGLMKHYFEKEDFDRRLHIAGVGEGGIWVCDCNGIIESGDYITSSFIPGYGMKQSDDIHHNYTVAKATMDCDFNPRRIPVKTISTSNINLTSNIDHIVYLKDNEGNFIYDELIDDQGNTIYEEEYKMLYINSNKNIIDALEYSSNIQTCHKVAFIGCSYHCS